MTRNRLVLSVQPRDADTPGYYDLQLDAVQLARKFADEPCVTRLCRKMERTRSEVLAAFTPGAFLDPATGKVGINAGYDPRFDEGMLEEMIWCIVEGEISRILGSCNRHCTGSNCALSTPCSGRTGNAASGPAQPRVDSYGSGRRCPG